ncbi:MAG: glutamate-5-semialdehyde dehydrogenase [Acidobacteria bacterium]|nr:glutamate-5-semialdehyde dehydrogenase [Acidobacteriota bacterium]
MTAVPDKTQLATSSDRVADVAARARAASRLLAKLSNGRRNEALLAIGDAIDAARDAILDANRRDCAAAQPAVASGKLSSAMFKRMQVSERGIQEMSTRVRDVTRLPDPLGRRLAATELDDGLVLYKESCPLGVIGFIFESRPDVIPQAASLTLKSGNAVILKGGSEAANTNEAIVTVWRECLQKLSDVPADSVQLLHSRADVMELLSLSNDVDLIVPRGSREMVEFIMQNSRIPVLGHGEGICHVYVDRAADLDQAVKITVDSKAQYPAVCNAAETLLVHQEVAAQFLPVAAAKLKEAGVELRGCPKTIALLKGMDVIPATEEDWATEYSDLILSIKVVANEEQAIAHINRYGSRHTDTIVTEDSEAARQFMDEVDAAGVFQNASTRFADGFRYGFGAEIGISNSKLHARGPVGLEGLTSYKYKLFGQGHTVAEYASGLKQFKHRSLDPSKPD